MHVQQSVFAHAAPRALLAICLITSLQGCTWIKSHMPSSMGGTPTEAPSSSSSGSAAPAAPGDGASAAPAGNSGTSPVSTPVSTPGGAPASPPPAQ